MSVKGTVLGGCALLGVLLVWEPVRSAEPLVVKPLVYQAGANATTPDNKSGAVVEQVQWRRGRGVYRGGVSVGIGYGGASAYYGRGYYPGYYGYYARPFYGYGSYYPRYYGYNYSYYSPSYVSIGIGGPGYSAYYGGAPYYGTYGYSSYYGGAPYYGMPGYCY